MNIIDNFYAKARRVSRLLGASDQFATTEFSEDDRNKSDLHRLFYGNDGPLVHKWKHYLSIYDRHLSAYRNKPVRFLEIGVFKGGSLALWRKYLGPEAVIFGIDIDPSCAAFDGRAAQVRIGSQDDPAFLENVVNEMGGLDVVIDDGSHISSHQTTSFKVLFPKLSETGVYICEDLHTSYWRGAHQGGYRRSTTFVEVCKRMVDNIHSDFHSHDGGTNDARVIHGIHFYNSMVVIEKAPQQPPAHIKVGN